MRMPEEILKDLLAATEEAKNTIRELHEARASLMDVDKKMKDRITKLIREEVTNQVGEISVEATKEMQAAFDHIADSTSLAIKEKLGI